MKPAFDRAALCLLASLAFGAVAFAATPAIVVNAPPDQATGVNASTSLDITVTDADLQPVTVTFYGRKTTPVTPGPDFVVGTLPDTQYYSENAGGNRAQLYHAQTQWYVDNRDALNLAFVSHMGDFVQNGDASQTEWTIADAAMARLEHRAATLRAFGIPFGGAPGNHDTSPVGSPTGTSTYFNQYFGEARFAGRTYYRGHYGSTNNNNYQFFTASGIDFIVIHLTYRTATLTTGEQAALDWADALLKAHPHRRAIVTSHWILQTSTSAAVPAAFGGPGQRIYENLKDNPNLLLLLCGHNHGEGRRTDVFDGRTVHSVLQDYQAEANGGNGWLRYFILSPANNTISARTYSPSLNQSRTSAETQFTLPFNLQGSVSDWIPLGTVNVPAGGGSAVLPWTGLETDSHYEWYAAASDGGATTTTSARRFGTVAAQAPAVTLTAPANGATYAAPAPIALAATASDTDGTVARVEFFAGATKLGEDASAPYAFSWTNAPAGTHALTAVAVDNAGLGTVSGVVNVTVAGGGGGGVSATIPLVEDFNAMGTGGTTLPAGWSIKNATGSATTWSTSIPGSGVAAMVDVVGTLTASASPTAGNINGYNTAVSGSTTDRVLSTCPTGNAGSAIQLQLLNTTGAAVTAVNVGYTIYRDNASSGANELPGYWLFYSLDNGATWTNVATLNPVISGSAGVVVPNTVGGTVVAPATITLASPWAHNATLLLRWVDDNANSYTDQVIGLNDVTVSAAGTPANQAPSAALTAPANGATFTAPATVVLNATAGDSDGTIARVEFFAGATKLGEDTTAPYAFTWTNAPAGEYTLTARATDDDGAATTSSGVAITINAPVVVPDVVGATQAAATVTLQGAGFAVTTTTAASATVPAGSVISQNPAGGISASGGSTVALVISSVPPQNITVLNQQTAQATTTSSTIALSYTVPANAGTNLLLSVQAGGESSTTNNALPASASFAGRAMTRAGAIRSTATGSNVGAGIFWLPVTAGESGTISVVFTGTCQQRGVVAVTLAGAAATGPSLTETAAGTANLTDQITTSGANALVLSTATQSNTGDLTATGTGHVRTASLALSSSRIVAGRAEVATPSTVTLGYSGTIQRIAMVLAAYPVGAPPVLVPDVTNTLQAAAESVLVSAGLQPGAITTAYHASVPAGFVISQNPGAGASVAGGSSVALLVSLGVEPPNVSPAVTLTTPSPGSNYTAPATVALTADASDTDGVITKVEFYAGAQKLGEDATAPYTFTWLAAPAGSHELTAVATDDDGAATVSAPVGIVIAPPNVAPTTALTFPANGATFTAPVNLALTADAGDSDGSVVRVEFFAGATKLGEDTTAPYEFAWTNVPLGGHTLTVRAIDDDGAATTSAAVAITVNAPPNTPPTVTLTAPADGANFQAPVNVALTATAADSDGTIARVEFYAGATKLGEDTSEPYAFTWTNAPAGAHTLTARAIDNFAGTTNSAPVVITIAPPPNVPPTVALATPFDNAVFTVGTNVSLTATAGDSDGTITRVEFFQGATKLGEDTTAPYAFTWTNPPAGAYTLTARATDNAAAITTSAPVAIIVNAPPTVALTAPANGATFTTPATVALTATAGDTDGTITLVEFYNGATKLGEDATAPYAFTWSNAPAGSHALTARATDNRGALTASAAVTIQVNSPTPSGLIAAYHFDEGSGTTLTDATGKGHTGTISGATWTTAGRYGGALTFNGTSNLVTIADANDLDFTTGMTLQAWVYPTTTSGTRDVIIKEGSGVDIYNLYARNWRGLPEGNVYVAGNNRTAEGTALAANTWTHLAATYDGSVVRLYVNGTLVANTTISGSITTSTGALRIGGNSLWGEYFQGRIDEVRIYNRALSAAEIVIDRDTPVAP